MTRSKSITGALVLCALAVCAFGAASAYATEGLTAVQCEKAGAGHHFNNSHCETPEASGEFETVPFALNKSVAVEGTATTTSVLDGNLSLVKVQITCKNATTTGNVTNVTPEGETKEMKIHGTEAVTKYRECTAHLESQPTEVCEVEGITGAPGKGKITTVALTSTSEANHKIKFTSPEPGELITEFKELKEPAGCNLPATTVHVNGSVIGTASTEKHSHITFSGEGTLTANGAAAKYTGTNIGHTVGEPEATVGATTCKEPAPKC